MKLKLSLSATELLESLRELVERGVDFPHPLAEAAAFELDDLTAATTGELVVRLKPSDRLAVLVAASRAGNVERSAV